MRARSSVGFHLLRSFQAPSLLARFTFLLALLLFRAERLLAMAGSHSPREDIGVLLLLAILPMPLPLESKPKEEEEEPEGFAPPFDVVGRAARGDMLGLSATGVEGDPEDAAAAAAAACVCGCPVAAEGEPAAAVGGGGGSDGVVEAGDDGDAAVGVDVPGVGVGGAPTVEAVSTISSSNRFRLMARPLERANMASHDVLCRLSLSLTFSFYLCSLRLVWRRPARDWTQGRSAADKPSNCQEILIF